MKYLKGLDNEIRYLVMDTLNSNPYFSFTTNFKFPPISYKYEISDKELEHLARKLQVLWFEIFDAEVKKLLRQA